MDIKTHEVFYDKLTYLYIELEKFNKTEIELETMLDKWLFVLKNLSNLMSRPAQLQERVFTKLFEAAEIAKFDSNELRSYEQSINAYRDIKNSIDTAKKEEKKDIARNLKQMGLNASQITQATGLSKEDIEQL
jgi:predicted transposase/invertase (TIGR01784 family)